LRPRRRGDPDDDPLSRLDRVNPRHRRLVIPLALGGLLLIVLIAGVVKR
jgi:hypothetical protein